MDRLRRFSSWPTSAYVGLFVLALIGRLIHEWLYIYDQNFILQTYGKGEYGGVSELIALPKVYQTHRGFLTILSCQAGLFAVLAILANRFKWLHKPATIGLMACTLFMSQWIATLFATAPLIVEGGPLPLQMRDTALLDENPTITLYSLSSLRASKRVSADEFQGWEVLGKVELPPGEHDAVRALVESIQQSRGWGSLCFQPRHAVRIAGKFHKLDLVVCFECKQVEAFGSRRDSSHTVGKRSGGCSQRVAGEAWDPAQCRTENEACQTGQS